MEQIIYRKAEEKDLPAILAMQADIFSNEQGIPRELVDAFMGNEPKCWCAELDGMLVGAAASWKEAGVTHWGRFVVLPEFRGHHIGTALVRKSFEDLFESGVEEIYMEARDLTVKIVCGMGGVVVGPSVPFYVGNVTPVLLKKNVYAGEV